MTPLKTPPFALGFVALVVLVLLVVLKILGAF